MNVQHECSEYLWRLAPNEKGWHCQQCGNIYTGDPTGYSPDMDKKFIRDKVSDILLHLTNAEFARISNGSEGDVLTDMIASRCLNENRFDQQAIIHFFFDLTWHDYSTYWRKIGIGIRSGSDPRDRCECGALANCWIGRDGKYCSEHIPDN